MVTSQTNVKTEEQAKADSRTPWQKSEYERRRTCYKKEFKNICLKHIQFLKRKEAIVDFARLFNVWQLYIKYKKLETAALLKYIASQSLEIFNTQLSTVSLDALLKQIKNWLKIINSIVNLLDKEIVELNHDINEMKNKNAFIIDGLAKFCEEFPDQAELQGKDFIHVLHEDSPSVRIDGKLVSTLADAINMNLINDAHKLEMKIYITNGNIQELELVKLMTVLATRRKELEQQKCEYEQFNEYIATKQAVFSSVVDKRELQSMQLDITNYRQSVAEHHRVLESKYVSKEIDLSLGTTDLTYNLLQRSLLEEQELADINTFDYRSFIQQEKIFIKTYRRNQAHEPDFIAEIESKLMDIREYRNNRQRKIRLDFNMSKAAVENNINNGKTAEEVATFKAQHKEQLIKVEKRVFANDTILPVPPTPPESKFNLEGARNAVIVAIAQTVCESLGRLAIAASTRISRKSPQELAGISNLDDAQISWLLQKHTDAGEKAMVNLSNTRKEICELGEEINQLIRGLE